tara:strand:- start:1383 stop:1910 length:528 start_codon:yes stop_codon:yes gene_type:complete
MELMPTKPSDKSRPAEAELSAPVELSTGGFHPSLRQRSLKAIAIDSSESGRGFLRDWIKKTRYCPFPGGQMNHSEWCVWLKQEGFRSWFYDFPFPRTVSEEDIESMDHTFWDAMRTNLNQSDNQSMQLYAKLTGKLNKSNEDDGANTQVMAWLREGESGAVAWTSPPKKLTEDPS